jgi:putative heme-binding domain-containing protein
MGVWTMLTTMTIIAQNVKAEVEAKEPNRGGTLSLETQDPAEAIKHLKVPEGYEINLFASEKEFPIGNPVSLTFDAKGRLWVVTMPTYPHAVPGVEPNDKLIILEDQDADGRADKHTVFADNLYVPTGFELGNGGAYIAQQPNVIFAKDTDGDDVADERHVVLHGFGTGDSHHSISAFTWGPGGGLLLHEGTFHRTQIETPYGPVRLDDAGVFRYEPRTAKVSVFVSYRFANPWGHVFDHWGQNFIADASGGSNYFGSAISGHVDHPRKHPGMKVFTTVVRPTAGCEIIRSRHFPDDVQGNFLVNNCIGFHGIKQHQMIEEDSGFTSKEVEPLLQSSDINFRPADLQFGPDGALYIVDWFNPLIGHMQYSLRDPNRDHTHGRIWRITYKGRPLLDPPAVAGRPLPELFELLRSYEDRTRYRVRAEIRDQDAKQVVAALKPWLAGLDPAETDHEHLLLEGLWIYQGLDVVEPKLLDRLLNAKEPRARAAATRVLRYWLDRIDAPLAILRKQVNDEFPRVRLEALLTLSFMPTPDAAETALQALDHSMDYYLDYVLKETMTTLEPYWKPAVAAGRPFAQGNLKGANYILASLSGKELANAARSKPIYEALLSRHGVQAKYRQEALKGLAKLNQTDEMTELISAIESIDRAGGDHAGHVLHDLGQLLVQVDSADLSKIRPKLERLARESDYAVANQVGFAAMIAADRSVEPTWKLASQSITDLRHLLDAVPMIADADLRGALYPRVEPLLIGLPDPLASKYSESKTALAQYVRIELPGKKRTLTLAEVQVHSDGANIAPRGKATQSATSHDGNAERAIDGKTGGEYAHGGQTHTPEDQQDPWWQLDLGSELPIEAVTVWNRTDGTLGKRLDNFTLKLLDADQKIVFIKKDNPAPDKAVKLDTESNAFRPVRRAAINAMANFDSHDAETFETLAAFVRDNVERPASIQAIQSLDRSAWDKAQAESLIDSLTEYIQEVPPTERTEPDVQDALQFAKDLAGLLPADRAKPIRAALNDLSVTVIVMRPIPHKMIYDKKRITVEAGKPVEIVFQNIDIMPHNLVIAQQGTLIKVGQAAERMATRPDATAKHFIPDTPDVLFATKLLQPTQTEKLQFIAPKKLGNYPYLCTFPGHWPIMNGTMQVVEKLDETMLAEATPEVQSTEVQRPFIQDWKIDDILGDLPKAARGRSYETGKRLFTEISCVKCHKMAGEGASVGPELTEVSKKYKRHEILRELIEPSKVIAEGFENFIIETKNGELFTGFILTEDGKPVDKNAETICVAANMLEPDKFVEIKRADIDDQRKSTLSVMPTALLVTLTKEEILDLVAYVEAGGNPHHVVFAK